MVLPKQSNPRVPCGENAEWGLSHYGDTVIYKEGPLTTSRKILIAITVVLGIIHFYGIYLIYKYHNLRKSGGVVVASSGPSNWDKKVLMWLILSGIGRYYHFIDNHYHPEKYHDMDIIYCGLLVGDTDAFVPFQVLHIAIGLYAAHEMFGDQKVSRRGYYAVIAFGLISAIGLLHYKSEPFGFFAFPQHFSILGEAVSGILMIHWVRWEYQHARRSDSNSSHAEETDLLTVDSTRSNVSELSDMSAKTTIGGVRRRSKDNL